MKPLRSAHLILILCMLAGCGRQTSLEPVADHAPAGRVLGEAVLEIASPGAQVLLLYPAAEGIDFPLPVFEAQRKAFRRVIQTGKVKLQEQAVPFGDARLRQPMRGGLDQAAWRRAVGGRTDTRLIASLIGPPQASVELANGVRVLAICLDESQARRALKAGRLHAAVVDVRDENIPPTQRNYLVLRP